MHIISAADRNRYFSWSLSEKYSDRYLSKFLFFKDSWYICTLQVDIEMVSSIHTCINQIIVRILSWTERDIDMPHIISLSVMFLRQHGVKNVAEIFLGTDRDTISWCQKCSLYAGIFKLFCVVYVLYIAMHA